MFASLFAVSCKKTDDVVSKNEDSIVLKFKDNLVDESVKGEFEIRNGVLHFKNNEAYQNQISKLSSNSEYKFTASGFESFQNSIDKLRSEYELMVKDEKYNDIKGWADKNSQFLKIDDGLLKFRTEGFVANFTNKDNIFYIGKILFKFKDGYETIVFDGDINKLETKNKENVRYFPYVLDKKSTRAKIFANCSAVYSKQSVLGNRRSIINAWFDLIQNPVSGGGYQVIPVANIQTVSQKVNIWGNWASNTQNQYRGTVVSLKAANTSLPFNNPNFITTLSINQQVQYNDSQKTIQYSMNPIVTPFSNQINPSFEFINDPTSNHYIIDSPANSPRNQLDCN